MRLVALFVLINFAVFGDSRTAPPNSASQSNKMVTVSVHDFGAKGDGFTDDRPTVQAAIDSLTKGGTACFPAGTYLMNSFITSRAGDNFNLVTSHDNITFAPCQGAPGGSVKLIQGPMGWGTLRHRVFGLIAVSNSEFFLASKSGQNGYQNTTQNGGYFTLRSPIALGSNTVAFATKAQAAIFAAGDWIAVSETTDQTIEPLEINQVVSVNAKAGTVGLRWLQTQTYPTGFAAKVTKMVRSHITISGLTLQGVIPGFLNDLYDVNILNCKLIVDTSYVGPGGGSHVFANGVRKMLFKDNVLSDYPEESISRAGGVELPQNNSIDVTIDHNTFFGPAGAGEYPEHWTIKNNSFKISGKRKVGVFFQGYDMSFVGNTVTATGTLDSLYSDFSTAPNPYKWMFGAQKIKANKFSSTAVGNQVIRLYSPDTEFSGNEIVGGPGQHGLVVQISGGPHRNIAKLAVKATNVITNNTFHCSVTQAFGCVLLSGASVESITFKDNTLIGHDNSTYGVWVSGDADNANAKMPALNSNRYDGFKTQVLNQAKRRP
ncbi:MAG TPA: glycosyl hydrolase family 28-related protein [Edaphobacter sp.]|nr:glycosyl hydrolase family 28-related protein [Edaphobacter sp.]